MNGKRTLLIIAGFLIFALGTPAVIETWFQEDAGVPGAVTAKPAAEEAAPKQEQPAWVAIQQRIESSGGSATQRYFLRAIKTEDAIRSGIIGAHEADEAHRLVLRFNLPGASDEVKEIVADIRQLSNQSVRRLLSALSGQHSSATYRPAQSRAVFIYIVHRPLVSGATVTPSRR